MSLFTIRAHADDALDAWASWALAPKVWKGQTVLAPEPSASPQDARPWVAINSEALPLRAHVPFGSSERQAQRSLRALERAYTNLQVYGWPLPELDGGQGGSSDLDLYLGGAEQCGGTAACARYEAPLVPSDFDAALTYAVVAEHAAGAELDACVHSALTQAGLAATDPAEADSWVYASAELAVWSMTGALGCDSSFSRGQQRPELGLLNATRSSALAGALFLGMLSERIEHAPATFVRSLWETTRQRSQGLVETDRLRSSPDLWEVLRLVLETQHLKLDDELLEFGVARYFAGPSRRKAQAPYRIFGALPSDAAVPIAHNLRSSQLPVKLREHPVLQELGSAYVRVALEQRSHSRMQVWLRGELGARWSLTAVRLADDGRELGRMAAPARNVPNAFLPVALDAETAEVILIVTQLPELTPDADLKLDSGRGYELIVELPGD